MLNDFVGENKKRRVHADNVGVNLNYWIVKINYLGRNTLISDDGHLIRLKSRFDNRDKLRRLPSGSFVQKTACDQSQRLIHNFRLVWDIFRIEKDDVDFDIFILSVSSNNINKLGVFFRKFRTSDEKNNSTLMLCLDLDCYHDWTSSDGYILPRDKMLIISVYFTNMFCSTSQFEYFQFSKWSLGEAAVSLRRI